jgi:poly(A) polymerase
MPVITPTYPAFNSTFNISQSTKAVILKEFTRGYMVYIFHSPPHFFFKKIVKIVLRVTINFFKNYKFSLVFTLKKVYF